MKIQKLLFVALILFIINACSKDDDNADTLPEEETQEVTQEDIEEQVSNFVTPDLIQILKDLGYTFNDGVDTPAIQGKFDFTTLSLVATNIENDASPGTSFSDILMDLSSLDPENRTFDFMAIEDVGGSLGQPEATFYSGNGSKFSAYVRLTVTYEEDSALLLIAISGSVNQEGINDAQYALIMLDNYGNPNGTFIENTEGRLFKDDDGLAERID